MASTGDVRLLIGDTDSNDYVLQDVDIQFFLSEASGNIYLAGSMAAEAIAARYARSVSESKTDSHGVHSQRRDLSDRYKHYKEVAQSLRKRYDNGQTASAGMFGFDASSIFAGGISSADKISRESDTDRLSPAFNRELHENQVH